MFIGVVSCTSSSDTATPAEPAIPTEPAPTVQLRIADDKNIDNNAVTIGTEDEEAVVRIRPCGRFATSFMSVLVEGEVDATYTLSEVEVPAPYYDSTTAANNTNTRSVTATKGESNSTFNFNIIIQPCVVSALLGSGTESDPWQINSDLQLNLVSELVNVANSIHADDHYILTADIDLKIADAPWSGGFGFTPIGTTSVMSANFNDHTNRFAGTFDCRGNIISNLYISNTNHQNTATNGFNKGLLGYATNGAVIRNCGLVNVDILAKETVGGLVGNAQGIRIERSFVQGVIRGTDEPIGGLAGLASLNTMIVESYVAGEVTNISRAAKVIGSLDTGGLIGRSGAVVINSYASVSLMGAEETGGLIGNDVGLGSITNSYAVGSITSLANTDLTKVYGLTKSAGTTTNSYWNTDIGHSTSPGGTGRTTAQMQVAAPVTTPAADAVYVDWDKDTPGGTVLSGEAQVWNFTAGAYPRLRRVPCPTRQHTSAPFTGNCSDSLPPQ
ncbi:hypothetical protein COTS27_00940 [Spirochaetota bacterium]|nr:hypothetical protein COTS27_00940 [Spirochaetota bacterium]